MDVGKTTPLQAPNKQPTLAVLQALSHIRNLALAGRVQNRVYKGRPRGKTRLVVGPGGEEVSPDGLRNEADQAAEGGGQDTALFIQPAAATAAGAPLGLPPPQHAR